MNNALLIIKNDQNHILKNNGMKKANKWNIKSLNKLKRKVK